MDLLSYIQSTNSILTVGRVIGNMLVTVLIAVFIYWVYKKTYAGVMYSKTFNVTLLLTTLVTAMVMMVIGTNLALSLGMVGALSVIRFRSAIKDPKDVGFLFWGIAAGLAAGTGSYVITVVGSAIIALMLFIFRKNAFEDYPYLLVVKGERLDERAVRDCVKDLTERFNLRMKSHTQAGSEIIYEVRFEDGRENDLIDRMNELKNVSLVNIVSYRGEVAG
jgi:hypothetical protein